MKRYTIALFLFLTCSLLQAQREVFLASSAPNYPFETSRFFAQPDSNFYVFLAIGQSNMVGAAKPEDQDYEGVSPRFRMMPAIDQPGSFSNNRGGERKKYKWYKAVPPLNRATAGLSPCDYFGRTMVEKLPSDIRVGIINVAVSGCCIEHFFKEYNPVELRNWNSGFQAAMAEYDSIQYVRLLDCALRAQHVGVIKGILLHQGESNVGDALWPLKVKKVYEDLLHDLGLKAEEVPLLAGEVVHAEQNGKSKEANKLVDILPHTVPTAHVISSRGCEPDPYDNNHFSAAGYRELGKRYAEEMLKILGYGE